MMDSEREVLDAASKGSVRASAVNLYEALSMYCPKPHPKHGTPDAGTWEQMWHMGSLYSHSVWVAKAALHFVETGSLWARGVNPEDIKYVVQAAIVHDTGKGGDLQLDFVTKANHEHTSAEYVLGTRLFLLPGNKTLNIHDMLLSIGWTEADIALIAFITRLHSSFGVCVSSQAALKGFTHLDENILRSDYRTLCDSINKGAEQCGLKKPGVPLDQNQFIRLLHLCFLISAADALGLCPTECDCDVFTGTPPTSLLPYSGTRSLYDFLRYDTIYIQARNLVLHWATGL
ncbi:hypothetical protein Pelo_5228 [Pelomyxa schiedti]|nr:hypothetical protein Pelo_5228 [Pelomyxa schiedti]